MGFQYLKQHSRLRMQKCKNSFVKLSKTSYYKHIGFYIYKKRLYQ